MAVWILVECSRLEVEVWVCNLLCQAQGFTPGPQFSLMKSAGTLTDQHLVLQKSRMILLQNVLIACRQMILTMPVYQEYWPCNHCHCIGQSRICAVCPWHLGEPTCQMPGQSNWIKSENVNKWWDPQFEYVYAMRTNVFKYQNDISCLFLWVTCTGADQYNQSLKDFGFAAKKEKR